MKIKTGYEPAYTGHYDKTDIEQANFDYDYPKVNGKKLDWHPKSALSKNVCQRIAEAKRMSRQVSSGNEWQWRRMEQVLQSFVPLDAVERASRDEDYRRPLCTMVPYSYATLKTYQSYTANAFLKPEIHRYRGKGDPASIVRAILRQRIVARYGNFFKESIKLLTAWEDMYTYGMGIIGLNWRKHKSMGPTDIRVSELLSEILKNRKVDIPKDEILRLQREETEFEGVELVNVSMWNAFLDPKMTPNEFQKSEYFGYMYQTNHLEILSQEGDPETPWFNGDYLKILTETKSARDPMYRGSDSDGRFDRFGASEETVTGKFNNQVHITAWFQNLIPQEWGLGDSEYPQKWVFYTVADRLVVGAQPLDQDHNMLPFVCFAANTNGHDVIPISHLATTFGIQEAANYIVRSRMHELMSSHNIWVYNPAIVETNDVLNPGPNKFIRIKPGAYNLTGGIDSFIKQLPQNSTTQGNYKDLEMLMDIAKDANGTVDIIRGDLSGLPERPGVGGVSGAFRNAASRLQLNCYHMAVSAMYDLAYMHGKLVDQYMDESVYVDVYGTDEAELLSMFGADTAQVKVDPMMLDRRWEVVNNFNLTQNGDNVESVTAIVQGLLQNPMASQEFIQTIDIGRVGQYWMEISGFPNANQFRRMPNVAGLATDGNAIANAQAGNYLTQGQAQAEMMAAEGRAGA